MSAASLSGASSTPAHRQFEAAMPAILATARFAFRRRRPQDRDEAVAEVLAAAWSAWHGLVSRGRDPVAVGVCGIANNSVRSVRNGRRVANSHCGRGAMDIHHPRARKQCGHAIVSLDRHVSPGPGPPSDSWRDWLAEDNRVSPADEACFRIDFAAWLARLPVRKRQMAELLAEGHETGVVAGRLGVTPGAVSQSRAWLEASWRAFQGGDDSNGHPSAGRPGRQTRARAPASPLEVG
jgi:DNA-directed RNA polymerase specialized sigma24 family protein